MILANPGRADVYLDRPEIHAMIALMPTPRSKTSWMQPRATTSSTRVFSTVSDAQGLRLVLPQSFFDDPRDEYWAADPASSAIRRIS
jgi:hypothetical protein